MGATPYTSESKIFFNIHQNMFVRRVTEITEGAVKRTTQPKTGQPKDIWELQFKDLSGRLKSIEVKETDFGKKYELTIEDVGEVYVLQVGVESGYGDTLISKIVGINPDHDIRLVPYSFIPKDSTKKKEGLNIYQGDVKIEPQYTKDNPNGKPQPESEKMDKDDWKIYNIRVRKFFAEVATKFNEKIKAAKDNVNEAFNKASESDDLPFTLLLPLLMFMQ